MPYFPFSADYVSQRLLHAVEDGRFVPILCLLERLRSFHRLRPGQNELGLRRMLVRHTDGDLEIAIGMFHQYLREAVRSLDRVLRIKQ